MMDRIADLLEATRKAIAHADFAAAAALAPALEQALAALPAQTDATRLAKLKSLAERNALCIAAARKGLRAAHRRMEEVRRAATGVQTYDSGGRLSDVPLAGATAGRF
jgi:hypothetical protein